MRALRLLTKLSSEPSEQFPLQSCKLDLEPTNGQFHDSCGTERPQLGVAHLSVKQVPGSIAGLEQNSYSLVVGKENCVAELGSAYAHACEENPRWHTGWWMLSREGCMQFHAYLRKADGAATRHGDAGAEL